MDREALNSKITEALGSTQLQLSEKTMNDFIDNVLLDITDDAMVTDEFVQRKVNLLKSFNGNLHADVAAQVNDYKSKNPYKKPEGTKEEPSNPDAKFEAYKSELNSQLEALKNELAIERDKAAKEAVVKRVRDGLVSKLKEAGVEPNSHVLKETIRDLEVSKDSKVTDLVTEAEKNYNSIMKELGLDFDTPRYSSKTGEKGKTAVDSFFAKKAKKEGWGGNKE